MDIKMKINWDKLWDEFENWFDNGYIEECRESYSRYSIGPKWPDQQDKIQELVEEQLKTEVKSE